MMKTNGRWFQGGLVFRRAGCVVALLVFLLCPVAPALAAQERNDAATNLTAAIAIYANGFRRLLNSRGFTSKQQLRALMIERGVLTLPDDLENYSHENVAAALRRDFPVRTAVLMYFYHDGELYKWLLTRDGIQGYHHAKLSTEELADAIQKFRSALGVDASASLRTASPQQSQRGIGGEIRRPALDVPLQQENARLIGLLLPPPIAGALGAVEHLIVVPVLGIGAVPFAALRPTTADRFLIEQMSISIAPSLFDVEQKVDKWQAQFTRPLVVGDPFLPSGGGRSLAPLPGAKKEATAVALLLGTVPLLGDAATKKAVLEKAPDADLLYFATHGVANDRDALSGGFLALSAETDVAGRWTAREVQNSKLKARLAVLSACQTGLGQVEGAGIIGLSRSFQLAGVPRVVMSLWDVSDQTTARLMESFVKKLSTFVPAEALRQAMLEMKQCRPPATGTIMPPCQSDPAQWSAFVLFGTPR